MKLFSCMGQDAFSGGIQKWGSDETTTAGAFQSVSRKSPGLPMMRPKIRTRMKLVGLIFVLACSELLGSEQSSLERARKLVSLGSFDKAEVMLRQTIAADPNNLEARVLLGTT